MSSNYQKILEFNKEFGVLSHKYAQYKLFDTDPKLVQHRLNLIMEEVGELQDAIKEKDFAETIDALTDILYVVYGAYTAFGINADDAFDIVHKSNMSKLCFTEQDAIDTVAWYKKNELRYDSPTYKKSQTSENVWVVYNESTSKVLKSIKYTPVAWE